MIYLIIYLVLVFITFVYSIYRKNLKAKYLLEQGCKGSQHHFFGILVSEPWWETILFSLLIAPFFIPLFVYYKCRDRYYRNRPRPIGRNLRHFIKLDRVLDDNGDLVTLEEYNQKHNTDFTLEQVYGKRFVKKVKAQEQKEAERQKEYEKQAEAERKRLAHVQSQSISEEDFDGPPF